MKLKLLEYKDLPEIPAGSNLEFYNESVYVVDDDASDMVILDKNWQILSTNKLFQNGDSQPPVSKTRSDLEATTIVVINLIPRLLVLGYDATDNCHKAVLWNLDDLTKEEHDISEFYNRLKEKVGVINIESAAIVLGKLVLCNRDHKKSSLNHIIVTDEDFWKNQSIAEITTISFDLPETPVAVVGLSGLTYSHKNDWLVATLLTEKGDAATGDSYLAVIENASRKVIRKKMKVNSLFHLTETSEQFNGYNIQSVGIRTEKSQRLKLQLLANNNAGVNGVFTVRVKN